MQTIAKFLKISKEQFINDFKNTLDNYDESQIENIYETIKLPKRATIGSAGYDFYTPINFTLKPQETINIPTDNEGHIFIKITNDSNENKTVELNAGQGFAQGIFMPFGLVEDDDTTDQRNGGFGSTNK